MFDPIIRMWNPREVGYPIMMLAIVFSFNTCVLFSVGYTTFLYIQQTFNASKTMIGFVFGGKGILTGISIVSAMHVLSGRVSDWVILMIALPLSSIGMLGYAFSPSLIYFIAFIPLDAISNITFPVMRAVFSKAASADMQGIVFAGVGSMETISSVLAPPVFQYIFSITNKQRPNLNFYIFAGMNFTGFIVSIGIFTYYRHADKRDRMVSHSRVSTRSACNSSNKELYFPVPQD